MRYDTRIIDAFDGRLSMVNGQDSDSDITGKIVFYDGGNWVDCMRVVRLFCTNEMKAYGVCEVEGEMKGVKYVMIDGVGAQRLPANYR